MKKLLIILVFIPFAMKLSATESLNNNIWKVTVAKDGEVKELTYRGEAIIQSIGDFGVANEKAVRPFKEVAELRDKNKNVLVYEGISDDGACPYVEFGEIVELNKNFNFTLYTLWLPPSPWPADSEKGRIKFAKSIAQIRKVETSKDELLPPGTLTYELEAKNGKKLIMKIIGADGKNTYLKKQENTYYLDFTGANNYVKDPTKENARTRAYWIASTDSHYVKFIIIEGE